MHYSVAVGDSRSDGGRDHGAPTAPRCWEEPSHRRFCPDPPAPESSSSLWAVGSCQAGPVLDGSPPRPLLTPTFPIHVSRPAGGPRNTLTTPRPAVATWDQTKRGRGRRPPPARVPRMALREDGFPRTSTHVGGDSGFAGLQWAAFSTRRLVTTTQVNTQNIVNRQAAPTGPPRSAAPEQTCVLGSRFCQIAELFSFYVKQDAPSTVQPLNDMAGTAWATSTGYFQ